MRIPDEQFRTGQVPYPHYWVNVDGHGANLPVGAWTTLEEAEQACRAASADDALAYVTEVASEDDEEEPKEVFSIKGRNW